jgi:hypothetical protein
MGLQLHIGYHIWVGLGSRCGVGIRASIDWSPSLKLKYHNLLILVEFEVS